MRPSYIRRALPASLRQILSQPLPALAKPTTSTSTPPSPDVLPKQTTVNGWIKSVRSHKSVTFLEVSDGSSAETLQAVLRDKGKAKETEGIESLTLGTSVSLRGTLQRSKGKGQALELVIDRLQILSGSDPEAYPIQKKHLPSDILRQHAHLRFRTTGVGGLMRLRDGLRRGWDDWFEANEFVHIQTPIITSSDCEGAGEAFRVTTLPPPIPLTSATPTSGSSNPTTPALIPEDFFANPAFLTVSSQLHLEAPTHALSRVYTLSPTFRAEASATSRHLAEFWMLEAEVGWLGFDAGDEAGEVSGKALGEVMDTLENGLKGVIRGVVGGGADAGSSGPGPSKREERMRKDIEAVWESVSKDMEEGRPTDFDTGRHIPSISQLQSVISKPFHRITYSRAIDILQKRHHRTKAFDHPPVWGASLQSEHEKYLAGWECLDGPVFVTDYPKALKPFYMRVNPLKPGDQGETVSCFDLLIPYIGELAGGSVREERLPYLEKAIEEARLDKRAYEWYLDLRRFGSVRHGGWGMGWERFMCWLTGVGNVKDVVAFPRYKGSCRY